MVTVFLAEGFEEIEAMTPVDLLRRAGIEVKTVGVAGKTVVGSHGIPVVCDLTAADLTLDGTLEAVVLPGGMPGTRNLEQSDAVQKALSYCAKNGKLIAAICAAPSVLGHAGLLRGKQATCFPGFEKELTGATLSPLAAVRDGNVVTSRGAGTAIAFAAEIIAALRDRAAADKIVASIQTPSYDR